MSKSEQTVEPTIDSELLARIDALAEQTTLTRDEFVNEALRGYLHWQEEFVTDIRAGIEQADRGEFASEEELERVVNKYRSAS